jgi:type IV pilus secretin PilQ/predicted competence protein
MGSMNQIAYSTLAVLGLILSGVSINYAESDAPATEVQAQPDASVVAVSGQSDRTSHPLALHLDDVEIRKALELLSREGSLNILVSSGVSGRVTANLEGLSFDRALDAILKLCNLAGHREAGLIYVYTQDEFTQLHQRGGKLATRVYHLKYLRGNDAEKMIAPFLAESGRIAVTPASEVGIGSKTDQAGGDSLAGGDVLIVQDFESVLETIDAIIARLDVQPTQVLIEAVITEVQLDHNKDLGVNFAVLDGAGRVLTSVGNALELNAIGAFNPTDILAAGNTLPGTSTDGFTTDTHGVKFGFVDKDITGFIRALESVGEMRVLASPRILVLNKQRAELIIGERIGFKTLTVTETHAVEKVEFLNVGTQLRLRPFVGNDGMIRMEIHPERSTGELVDGLPRTTTSEVTTNVIVPDGSTVVIAGLMQDREDVEQSGVPGLSRLRWLGAPFRQRSHEAEKKELIVLLTPRIWNPVMQCAATGPPQAAGSGAAGMARVQLQCSGPLEAVRGEPVSAQVTVTNASDQPAEEVRLQPILPRGVSAAAGSPAVWTIGTLQPGQSETIEPALVCSQAGTMLVRFLAAGRNNLGAETHQRIQVREPEPPAASTEPKRGLLRRLTSHRPADAPRPRWRPLEKIAAVVKQQSQRREGGAAAPPLPAQACEPVVAASHQAAPGTVANVQAIADGPAAVEGCNATATVAETCGPKVRITGVRSASPAPPERPAPSPPQFHYSTPLFFPLPI